MDPIHGSHKGKRPSRTTGADSGDGGKQSCSLRLSALLHLWIRPQQLGIPERLPGKAAHGRATGAHQFLLIYPKQQICLENTNLQGFSVTSNQMKFVFV